MGMKKVIFQGSCNFRFCRDYVSEDLVPRVDLVHSSIKDYCLSSKSYLVREFAKIFIDWIISNQEGNGWHSPLDELIKFSCNMPVFATTQADMKYPQRLFFLIGQQLYPSKIQKVEGVFRIFLNSLFTKGNRPHELSFFFGEANCQIRTVKRVSYHINSPFEVIECRPDFIVFQGFNPHQEKFISFCF